MYKKHSSFSFTALLFVSHVCLNMDDLAQLECYKLGCMLLASPDIIIAIRQLYNISESVTMLLGQLKVDTGLANWEWRPTLRRQLTSIIVTIFTSTISFPVGYQHSQANSRAPRVICFRLLIKIFYYNNFKSCQISRKNSDCSF